MSEKYPFESLRPGKSFFVPNAKQATVAGRASSAGRKLGMKFSAHKVVRDGVPGVHVICRGEREDAA